MRATSKISTPPVFVPRALKAVAGSYTDWTNAVLKQEIKKIEIGTDISLLRIIIITSIIIIIIIIIILNATAHSLDMQKLVMQ